MIHEFDSLNFLQNGFSSGKTAHLQIKANSVNWDIYLVNGKLQYAQHSLQSLETIRYYLMRLAPHVRVKITSTEAPNNLNNLQLLQVINQLFSSNNINSSEKIMLIKELSRDALESFLCLKNGDYKWSQTDENQALKIKTIVGENVFEPTSIIKSLQIRLQQWQKLSPFITSPHQRPVFVNISLLQEKVPNGNLSPAVLMQLIKLMKGLSIRQLSLLLKQDELKLAGLLLPYIQHNIVKVHPAKASYDQLPTISALSVKELKNSVPLESTLSNKTNVTIDEPKITVAPSLSNYSQAEDISSTPSKSLISKQDNHKKHKIICIDDSPTMLETIKDYLGSDQYEVLTVENPMQSLSYLFDSKPDLILMDLSMPGINGNRLSQILKSSSVFKKVPIIIISGNTGVLNKGKIEEIGAKDFLAKPFTKNDLLAIVNKYLQPLLIN